METPILSNPPPTLRSPRRALNGLCCLLAVVLSIGCGGPDALPSANVVGVVTRVELTPGPLALVVNASQQLSAVGYDARGTPVPGKAVSFTTDNALVAAVSGTGLVTAVGAGTATITASIDVASASLQVTVSNPPSTGAVERVTLSPGSLALTVGHTAPLVATTLDAQGRALSGKVVTFSIDKPSVASVSSTGLVTALVPGTATITASSEGKSGRASVSVTTPPASGAVIDVIPGVTHQTMLGWEATSQTGEGDPACNTAAIPNFRQTLFDRAIDELGISRVRVEIRSGIENPASGNETSYNATNDNADPNVIDPAGFQWGVFDSRIDMRVVPFRQALQARGERLYVVLTYVDFSPTPWEHARDAQEYAEFILAAFQHMQSKYGFVPDAVELALEPDKDPVFNALTLANALVATGDRLKAAGFRPAFIAPSTTKAANAPIWFDRMTAVPRIFDYLTDLAYHRYNEVSPDVRPVGARATQYRLRTAMNEHIGANYIDLHDDLIVGGVSSWQQYTLAFCLKSDDGSFYYWIDQTNPSNVQLRLTSRARFLRQYFKFIRPGAVRVEATSTSRAQLDPVAFRNNSGTFVVVVKATGAGSFTVRGLPAGVYGIKYTTAAQYDVDAPDVTIAAGGTVTASIPATGAITVYGR